MQYLRQATQVVAVGVVIAAGGVLAVNEFRRLTGHRAAEARARQLATLGESALHSGDPALAVRFLTDASAEGPDSAAYRPALARAQARLVLENEEAVETGNVLRLQAGLEAAINAGDPDEYLQLALGRLCTFRGQWEAARRRYEQVLGAQPKHAKALMYLGDLEFKTEQLDQAQATLRRAVEADPTLTLAKFALGQVYAARNAWKDALPWLETAARESPRNGQAALAYGRALAAEGQSAEAIKFLERALALDARLVAAYGPLGDAYVAERRIDSAAQAFRQAWERNHDLDALRKLGRIYAQLGSMEAAATIFAQVRDLVPNDPEPYLVLGVAAAGAGQAESAAASFTRCAQLSRNHKEWASLGEKCESLMARPEAPKRGRKAADEPPR